MLDIRLFREEPERVREGLARLGEETAVVDRVRDADEAIRELKTAAETRKAELNSLSKAMARATPAERESARGNLRALGDEIARLDGQRSTAEDELNRLLLGIPNLPDAQVPDGADESANVVLRTVGEPRTFDFEPRPHWEIGEQLGILDIPRGVKVSGARFYVLTGAGAALQRALISFMLDLHIRQHGYTEVYPPYMVKQECLVGTGNLPKFAENLYHDAEEDFWLIPTAEVPLTNLHRDEILDRSDLPRRYVAYTPCFRRERMSAGRDVRGIKRGHQFDKVEMVKLVEPSQSDAELLSLIGCAEAVCAALEIPHRVVQMCTGDLSFVSAAKQDVELWSPACGDSGGEWLEVSSCSNFRDYQARRTNLRYRPEPGGKPALVHTLNGSGLALPRTLISVLENYQEGDGSVRIPRVLRPWMGGAESIAAD
ncbi:MAG: serine--tRNA ligase [Armatimonadetes bacterium]|nr:serine--tRNA ligase [Armatimonadota bacterium]MDE2207774.1 serine--tRNA ligase [Armatimonadota bacterium]